MVVGHWSVGSARPAGCVSRQRLVKGGPWLLRAIMERMQHREERQGGGCGVM